MTDKPSLLPIKIVAPSAPVPKKVLSPLSPKVPIKAVKPLVPVLVPAASAPASAPAASAPGSTDAAGADAAGADTGDDDQYLRNRYKKLKLRDHIYQLPDTYIGGVDPNRTKMWLNENGDRMREKTVTYIPGLYKIFDEVLVNALDQHIRMAEYLGIAEKKAKGTGSAKYINAIGGCACQKYQGGDRSCAESDLCRE